MGLQNDQHARNHFRCVNNIQLIIKVLCEQTREVNKRIKIFFELCLILFGFENSVADFHV